MTSILFIFQVEILRTLSSSRCVLYWWSYRDRWL